MQKDDGKLLDIAFNAPQFDPVKYARKQFISGTEQQARLQFGKLVDTKQNAALLLQRNVFDNYPIFISTSKEIKSTSLFSYFYLLTTD